MLSAQECAQRLREQAYKTLSPQIQDLEKELRDLASAVSSGLQKIDQRLDSLRHIELPTTEVVLDEIFNELRLQQERESGSLALFAQGLRQRDTQEEILSLLLDQAAVFFPRAALFAVRGDKLVGWSSRGFSEAQAQTISHSSLGSECKVLDGVLESTLPIPLADISGAQDLSQLLGENPTDVWHVMPLRVLKRPVALLLTGGERQSKSGINLICILAELASLRLENLALKILHELTGAEYMAPGQPSYKEEPVGTSAAFSEAQIAPVTPAVEQAPAQFAKQLETTTPKPMAPESEEAPPVKPAPEAEPQEMAALASRVTAEEVSAPKPPTTPPSEPLPIVDEEKLHADAKRFARLLVSEIKLYNEHHVVEGRQNRDLYIRLKRDIDRSREMYEKRVSPIVSRKVDYFHDEIVRILGDNDPSTLGSDYPGPRVEN